MKQHIFLPLLAATCIGFCMTSCSKKMGALSSEYFNANPSPLEAIGGEVPVTINGTFPEKYLKKKAVITVTPVLRYQGGEMKGEAAAFQGEKVQGNSQTIAYKRGGNYTMRSAFNYAPEMANSELYLTFNAAVGNKQVNVPDVKIADGIIATSMLANETLRSASTGMSSDAFQKEIKQANEANILFIVNRSDVRTSEARSESVEAFKQRVKAVNEDERLQMTGIELSAYASPEGSQAFNDRLAAQRKVNAEKFLQDELKKGAVQTNIDSRYTAEDWEGFQELVSKSNLQDKELILRVLSMYQDSEQREREIRNISAVYGDLAKDILPQLRRARLTLNYTIIGKSDEEIDALSATAPEQLTIEELLYAATLTDNMARKEAIYTAAMKQYPSDFRAYNNLASLAYKNGDFASAGNYLTQASQLNSDDADVKVNQALLALRSGNQSAAQTLLGAAGSSVATGEALGNLYLQQGKYAQAVTAFGDAKSNSAALAQILATDYNKARATLAAVPVKDAYTDYLGAVLAARTNNATDVVSSLRSAINKDASLAKRAATDMEFAKLADNAAFQALVR